jgi:hypothetical protein
LRKVRGFSDLLNVKQGARIFPRKTQKIFGMEKKL